jgi:hypothetical protein
MIPPSFHAETRLRISPSVYARAFGEELVLLDFARGEYFGLDEVGATIWRRLEAGDCLRAIADVLVEHFDVSHDQALADIVQLVTQMHEQALVSVSGQ